MLCKNIIQKVSNMVLFKDCKSSSATICKSSSAANMPPNINTCIRKIKEKKKLGIIEVQAVAKITTN